MYDFVIIGGGIIGMSTAMQLIDVYPDARIALLEKESGPACHQTVPACFMRQNLFYHKKHSVSTVFFIFFTPKVKYIKLNQITGKKSDTDLFFGSETASRR